MWNTLKQRCKPHVHYHALFVLAGLMWTAVGLMLLWRASIWLSSMEGSLAMGLVGLSVVLMVAFYAVMFRKTVQKNIARLASLPERVCLFAFNSRRGYALILFMIVLGITLRHSPIPRPYLAVVYTTMGGTLLLSSFHFYHRFWNERIGG